jgi:predicted transcriptional regulator
MALEINQKYRDETFEILNEHLKNEDLSDSLENKIYDYSMRVCVSNIKKSATSSILQSIYETKINDIIFNISENPDLINKLNRIPYVKNNKIDILVIKLSKNGYLGSSKPCMHCLNIMYKSKCKIRYIYYSNNKREIVREKFTQMDTNHISMGNKWKLGLLIRD